jgi:hypothetical protein
MTIGQLLLEAKFILVVYMWQNTHTYTQNVSIPEKKDMLFGMLVISIAFIYVTIGHLTSLLEAKSIRNMAIHAHSQR